MSYVRLCGYVVKVDPLTVLAFNYALCTQNHTEGIVLGEGLQRGLYAVNRELLCSLTTEAGEHLVSVMVVSVVMATAGAVLAVIVVMIVMVMLVIVTVALFTVLVIVVMMVMLVIVTVALLTVVVIVVMMVMLVIVTVALFIVMVMLVIVAVALFTVVVIVVMMVVLVIVTVALFTVVVIVVMMVMLVIVAVALLTVVVIVIVTVALLTVLVMFVMLVLLLKLFKSGVKSILLLHSGENVLAVQLIPRGSNYNSGVIVLSDKLNGLFRLVRFSNVGVREDDTGCVGNLIVIEFTEVFHIHLALVNVCDSGEAIEHSVCVIYRLNRLDNVRELSYAARLDNNSVGVELVKHLCERL